MECRVERETVGTRGLRLCRAIIPLSLLIASPAAGEADLDRNGDPSDHPVVWYSRIGMALKEALRENSDKCYHHVGEIVICKKREDFRIPPQLRADRPSGSGSSRRGFDAYLPTNGN